MLRARVGVFVLVFAVAVAAAQAPIRHEDVWLMKRVGAPAVSPDGKWVVFAVTEPAYDEKDQASDLWIAPADGSVKPRRLTATKGAESGVAWSPDSSRIAFSAKRESDEEPQIYVLDLAAGGGEAMRVTSLSTGAKSPRWRPDGKGLLFVSAVYPGAADDEANRKIAAEQKARKYRARVYDAAPIRHWDGWTSEKQTHVFVQPLEPGAKAKDLLAGTKLAAERGFGGSPAGTGVDDEIDAVWAPDGQSIVFVATTEKDAQAYSFPRLRLYQAAASGGEPKQLTSGDDSFTKPAFRPDGKALYALHHQHGEKAYYLTRLAMFAWPSPGERTIVTAGLDRSVESFAFTPDGQRIYLLAEEAGHEKLFTAPAGGGEARPAFDVPRGVYTNLAIAEKAAAPVLVANWESAVSPAEVVRIDAAAGRHRALSDFNAERVAAIDWQPLREFWFTSKKGKRIHNMIALPPNFDERKKYPLFVVIHGGPHNMWRDYFFVRWNYHLLAAPGYVVLLTDYTGSTGFGEKFAQEIEGDPFVTVGEEINEAADEAIRRYSFIDGTRQAAGGASYGGSMAAWLLATTDRYKCLIDHAGIFDLESMWGTTDINYWLERLVGSAAWEQPKVWQEQNAFRRAKNFKTPMLVTHGENDFRVPLGQALEVWSVLQRLKVPSRLVVFPEANHWVMKGEDSRMWYGEVQAWLKKWLGE